jgi:hypothetical protein
MTDLETVIRDAMQSRAEAVPIRHSALVVRRRRWLPPLLAAALVIALVALTAALVARSDHRTPAASGNATFVGSSWRLVRIDDGQGRLMLPASTKAAVAFGRDGQMTGNDTVHALSAHYRLVASGYEPDRMTASDNGIAGPITSAMKRTVGAMGTCFSSVQGDSKPARLVPIAAKVQGDRLVLHTGYGVLTFVRTGPVPSR